MTFEERCDIITVMKKKSTLTILYMVLSVLVCMVLTGCSMVPSLNLTQEQEELVSEYAAGVLVKYAMGHEMGLTPVTEEELNEEPIIPVDNTVAEQDDFVIEESSETPVVADVVSTDESAPSVIVSEVPIGQVFGIDGFDIAYSGYEIQKIYPSQESSDLVFSMQASNGKSLLVVHFNLTNGNESEATFDAASTNIKARVSVDGGERIPAQTTILLNDLLTYSESIASYGMVDSVMVFEVPEEYEAGINSLNLILVGPSGENEYKLI